MKIKSVVLQSIWDGLLASFGITLFLFFIHYVACNMFNSCLIKSAHWLWVLMFVGLGSYFSTVLILTGWRAEKDEENRLKAEAEKPKEPIIEPKKKWKRQKNATEIKED